MFKRTLLLTGALAFALAAQAQTKISGSTLCAKADINHVVPVGDQPDHVYALTQGKCTWTKPIEMGGAQATEDLGSGIADVRGTNSKDDGYVVGTMSNGDKTFVTTHGTSKVKGEILESGSGTWRFTGGTGKFKNLKGSGTFKFKGNPDGTVVVEVEGSYTLGK